MNFLKQGLIEQDRKLKERSKQEVQKKINRSLPQTSFPLATQNYGTLPPKNYGTLPQAPSFMQKQPTGVDLINKQIDTGTLPNLPKKSSAMGAIGKAALSAWSGIGAGFEQTANLVFPVPPITKAMGSFADMPMTKAHEQFKQQSAKAMEGQNKLTKGVGWAVEGVVGAVPAAVMGLMSGGVSAAPQVAQGALTGMSKAQMLGNAISTSVQSLAKNPMFWNSFSRTAGPTYTEAKQEGASELEAQATAFINGFLGSAVEVGGGLETFKPGGGVRQWVRSMLEEGKEGVLQGIIENLTKKVMYDKGRAAVSLQDDNAVINPLRAGKEFAGGAVVGGILGGAQKGISKGLDVLGSGVQNYGTLPPRNYGTVPTETPQATQNYGTLPPKNYGTVPNAVNLPPKQAVQAETQQGRVNVPQPNKPLLQPQNTGQGLQNLNNNGTIINNGVDKNTMSIKSKQLDVIAKNNPAPNNTLTWVRSEKDIKTFQEVIEDFGVGESVAPDYTNEMIKEAFKTGKITVYSSYPVEQGVFVTPSKMEAKSYAGGGKIYSKEVSLADVAWIDEIQGQYAFVEPSQQNLGQNKPLLQPETQQSRVNVPMQQETDVQGQETAKNYGQNTVGAAEYNPSSYDALLNTHGAIPPGEKPARNVDVPKKDAKGKFVSKFARTMMEAGATPDVVVSEAEKQIANGTFSHEVVTDKNAKTIATRTIENNGFDGALQRWESITNGKETATKNDIALGQLLFNQAANAGDTQLALKLAAELATEATRAGQTVQAFRLLKQMTPDGRLYSLEKASQKLNNDLLEKLGAKAPDVKIDEKLAGELLNAKTQNEIDVAVEKIQQNIADQVPATWTEKWNAWRYLSMLGNPRTHIRNIVGNAAFVPVIKAKNIIGVALEKTIPKAERTKSLNTSKQSRDFAKADFEANSEGIRGESKYDIAAGIQDKRTIFKTKAFEKARRLNFAGLEAEDVIFLKRAYVDSFAQAMEARGLTVEFLKSGTKEANQQLAQISVYATNEARKATYRDKSALANALNKFERSHKAIGFVMQGALPFKKTPINILKRGVEYSPIGLTKGLYDQFTQVEKGNKTSAEALDEIASGLSGTAVMALGVFLASMGLISGGKDDDKKKQAFEQLQGFQNYALQIGDKSYTLDWAQPAAMPFFVGVEIYNSLKDGKGFSTKEILDATARITEPMFEMSMLQGVNSTLKAGSYSEQPLTDVAGAVVKSYFGQGVPTLAGQTARTIDSTRRSTYIDKNSPLPQLADNFVQQSQAKLPFLSKALQPRVDQWGRELKGNDNVAVRIFENYLSPGYLNSNKSTALDKEIGKLYKSTGEKAVIPSTAPKYFNVDGKRIDLTAAQYTRYAKAKGQNSYEYANRITKNPAYKKLADVDKAGVIATAYEYANARAKTQVSNYKLDGWYKKAEKAGVMLDDYLILRQMLPPTPTKPEVAAMANKISPSKKSKLVNLYYGK